jgi:glucosylceramidase
LKELFSTEGVGIGISYLRLSVGASDLNERVFSYDDIPVGQTDFNLEHFDLSEDKTNVIPIMKEILAINPKIKILASPWSAPAWMKTNGRVKAGRLKLECYPVYAAYFVKYIQAMASQGIPIDALTIQNEPFNDGNTPSMQMFPKEQGLFIKEHLGPALRAAGLKTKIILFDHNCDAPQYAVSILTDPEVRPYVDGSGFHLYAGSIKAMSIVHDRFPDKHLYFTEQMVVNWNEFNAAEPMARVLIGAARNWSRNVLLWNLAADAKFRPHTEDGGCPFCQGAITITGNEVVRNVAYYVVGHASKFIPEGSLRIGSTENVQLPNVAFLTPEGKQVLIVANPSRETRSFNIVVGTRSVQAELPSCATATYVW